MEYMTVTEAAELWGISKRAVNYHITAGRIPGALQKGRMWLIPKDTQKPEDLRKHNRRKSRKEDAHNEQDTDC